MFKTIRSSKEQWSHQMISLVVLVICFILMVFIAVFEANLTSSVRIMLQTRMQDTSEQIDLHLHDRLSKYRADIQFLNRTPPLFDLTQNYDGLVATARSRDLAEQWARLNRTFLAFLESNRDYEQLRVIDIEGMELVRVQRAQSQIETVEDSRLQNKGDREYFAKSIKLNESELYVSDISLNQEFGKIEFPYRPTLRTSLPIFDSNRQRLGFVIANINMQFVFESLYSFVDSAYELVITDSEGFYLVTSDDERRFSRDLGLQYRWSLDYALVSNIANNFSKVQKQGPSNTEYLAYSKKIWFAGNREKDFYTLKIMVPMNGVQAIKMQRRIGVYAFAFAIMLISLIVLFILYRSMRRGYQLADARALSAAIVSGSKNAIISTSPDFKITSWNLAAERMFGFKETDAIGQDIDSLTLFDDLQIKHCIALLSPENPRKASQGMIYSDDGSPMYLSLSLSAIIGENQSFNGTAILVRDETLERISDAKIKQVNAELEQKVAERTTELRRASTVKNAFISNISHEMRTPLNGIMGTLSLVQKEPLSSNQKRFLEMTEVSVNTLAVLINDILDLSKIEAGKLEIDNKAFNPIRLLESLCGSLAVKAQDKGLEFILDIVDLEFESITSDPYRISQIMTNLVNNAIKFTDSGYIKITAYSQNMGDRCRLCCAVKDSGIGIAKENHNKLFKAFSQETTAIAGKYGGTGLGLSICKQLASLLNGDVAFSSTAHTGSEFTFYIDFPHEQAKLKVPEPRLRHKNCLVITDSPPLTESILKLVTHFSGNPVDSGAYVDWLEGQGEPPELPLDYVFIDADSPYFQQWKRDWENWAAMHIQLPMFLVLHNSGEPVQVFEGMNIMPIGKPILLSDFLQKSVDARVVNIKADASKRDSDTNYELPPEDIKNITGANILVVDDNEINIEVASGMLSSLPINISKAVDGQQVLDILTAHEQVFHCILMDCQMPILNGYEVSRAIRNGEAGKVYMDIPIIAMTANAMLGERKKCTDAGMSDYITKPINIEVLIDKLTRWTLSTYMASEKNIHGLNDISSNEDECWDKKSALIRLMDNEELLRQICRIFIEKSSSQIASLEDSLVNNDMDGVKAKVHTLKGSTGDLGATILNRLFKEMEEAAIKQDLDAANILLSEVKKYYPKFVDIITLYST